MLTGGCCGMEESHSNSIQPQNLSKQQGGDRATGRSDIMESVSNCHSGSKAVVQHNSIYVSSFLPASRSLGYLPIILYPANIVASLSWQVNIHSFTVYSPCARTKNEISINKSPHREFYFSQ